jgi:hypothetical protein
MHSVARVYCLRVVETHARLETHSLPNCCVMNGLGGVGNASSDISLITSADVWLSSVLSGTYWIARPGSGKIVTACLLSSSRLWPKTTTRLDRFVLRHFLLGGALQGLGTSCCFLGVLTHGCVVKGARTKRSVPLNLRGDLS